MKKETGIIFGILIIAGMICMVSADLNITEDDSDEDGFNVTIDCDDNNSIIWQDIPAYVDNDDDGFGAGSLVDVCSGNELIAGYSLLDRDCNDNFSEINPNGTDILQNGIDENCDGFDSIDIDGDGFLRFVLNLSEKDCDDNNPEIYPTAAEKCNGVDDDCDGQSDEDFDKGEVCFIGIGECRTEGVMFCNENLTGTRCRAVAKNPSPELCDGKDNDCDDMIDEEDICNTTIEGLIINSPDLKVYNINSIPVNISLFGTLQKADEITYIDYSEKRLREITLCRKCNDYGKLIKKTIRLKDGDHDIVFKALINGIEFTNSTEIFIDSKKPIVYLPRIRAKGYTNGSFYINYDEYNVKNAVLFYENESLVLNNCSSGKKQTCVANVNLSEYNSKDIVYSFGVEDVSGNFERSKNLTAVVDLTPPEIEELDYAVIWNSVYLKVKIKEDNLKDVSYYDNSSRNPKWRVLCSVLKDSMCQKRIRLSPGEHNITIMVNDKAGNSVFAEI